MLLLLGLAEVMHTVRAWELSGRVGVENMGFLDAPAYSGQHRNYVSAVAEPELYHGWDDGHQSFTFMPFYRYSQYASRRTHFDVRELAWLKAADNWELRVGISRVFWGVTESQNLVDIVNQKDFVEDLLGREKLGQPMFNLALIRDWGTLNFYVLPGFRKRNFFGFQGRFRPSVPISDRAQFVTNGFRREVAYALRWSRAIGPWDIGLSQFYGTSREPLLFPQYGKSGQLVAIIPRYYNISQTGLDVQLTQGSWLWKMESIVRLGQLRNYFAGTGGFEYSFYGILDSSLDLGVLAEYMYDSRGNRNNALLIFPDDFFVALRFNFNDVQSTNVLAGLIFDRRSNAKFYSLEVSRRLADSWKLRLISRVFAGAAPNEHAYFVRKDSYVSMEVSYHF